MAREEKKLKKAIIEKGYVPKSLISAYELNQPKWFQNNNIEKKGQFSRSSSLSSGKFEISIESRRTEIKILEDSTPYQVAKIFFKEHDIRCMDMKKQIYKKIKKILVK